MRLNFLLFRTKPLLCLCCLFLGSIFLRANEFVPLDTSTIYSLDEVECVHYEKRDDIVPSQHLSAGEIEKLDCQSVADALRYFSGVQIKDYGGIGGIKTINIRSMGTNQMGVFYDGIQLGNAQNGQVDLGRFSLDNMESIDLYDGQRASILQSAKDYGSAGTIYMTSKRPSFTDGKKFHLVGTFKTGSFGLVNPSFLWQHKLSDKVSSSVSAEYTYANGKYKFRNKKLNLDGSVAYDTVMVRENADVSAVRTEASFYGKLKEGEWKAQVYNYYSARGLPGYVARNVYQHEQRQWDDNFFVQGSFQQKYWDRYTLLVNAKYAYDYTRYLNPDTTLKYVDNTYQQQEAYVSMANSVKIFPWWNMGLSADFQWNTLDSDMPAFAYPTRCTELVALATAFRFPHVKVQASVLGTFVQEEVQVGPKAPNKNVFTPAVFVSVRPWKNVLFDIRTYYKRIFRMPTFNDLYYTFIGNALLDPEYVTQYDLGVTYRYQQPSQVFHSFGVQLDAYYNEVEDKIVAVPSANPFRWQMMNLGVVQILGVDANVDMAVSWHKDWNLGLKLTYTYQMAQDFTDPTENYYGDQIPYVPWNSGSVVGDVSYKDWGLNYSFIYTGERYNQSANIPENYVQPWYTHDLSLRKTFRFKHLDFKVALDVNNIFNQQYDVVLNYPMPGTNFKVTLKLEL